MTIDLSDALIATGFLALCAGLYFIAWPLVLVAAGLAVGYVGVRRA